MSAQMLLVDPAEERRERLRAPLADLAEQIAGRLRMPLHADEATATLESLGVTDAVAERNYGSTDTFALAHSLWPRICEIAAERTAFGKPAPTVGRAPVIDAALRGATALAPLAALLAVIGMFAEAGWPVTQLLCLSTGITLALVLSAGPATAMVFRASVLIGVGHVHAADRFLLRTCGLFFAASGRGHARDPAADIPARHLEHRSRHVLRRARRQLGRVAADRPARGRRARGHRRPLHRRRSRWLASATRS